MTSSPLWRSRRVTRRIRWERIMMCTMLASPIVGHTDPPIDPYFEYIHAPPFAGSTAPMSSTRKYRRAILRRHPGSQYHKAFTQLDILLLNRPPDPSDSHTRQGRGGRPPAYFASYAWKNRGGQHRQEHFSTRTSRARRGKARQRSGTTPMPQPSEWCIPCSPAARPLVIPLKPGAVSFEEIDADSWRAELDRPHPVTVPEAPSWAIATTPDSRPPFEPVTHTATALKSSLGLDHLHAHVDQDPDFGASSHPIGIDNRCSLSISGFREDFVGPLVECSRPIDGFSGHKTTATHHGTIHWEIEDNTGMRHTFRLPRSLYVPGSPHRLLSPQHWAQTTRKREGEAKPLCITTDDRVVMMWNNLDNVKTIPIDANNVFTTSVAPSYKSFTTLCHDQRLEPHEYDDKPPTYPKPADTPLEPSDAQDTPDGLPGDMPMQGICPWELEELQDHSEGSMARAKESPSAELLRYHYKYNHISFRRLQEMAKTGLLPARLSDCPIPHCAACSYGKATRVPKRTKVARTVKPTKRVRKPGDCVSVDVLTSKTPGLIAQMSGFLTRQRYKHACVFLDHVSDHSYVYLLKDQSGESLIEAKKAYEIFASASGVKIKHYHADNGIFAAGQWRRSCMESAQGLTFAGVNSHHQNGRAERRIRSLQDQARTMLIHGAHRWEDAIEAYLWPYAVRAANDSLNNTPSAKHGYKHTPTQLYARTRVSHSASQQHPLFCPAYVLDTRLQQGQSINKWMQRATMGIYMGRSPNHARSVALVLNLKTGRVSPQYHVRFDPSFRSVDASTGNKVPNSLWQVACGFRKGKSTLKADNRPGTDMEPAFVPNADTPESLPLEQSTEDPMEEEGATEEQAPPQQDPSVDAHEEQPPEAEPNLRRSSRSTRGKRADMFHEVYSELGSNKAHSASVNQPKPEGEIFALESLYPMAMASSTDPDIMCYHEAMRQPDAPQFTEAAIKEYQDILDKGVLKLVNKSDIPSGTKVFKAVWAMRRKRRIMSREVYKWKARLNFDGSQQIKDVDYDISYAPVVAWESVRVLLALVLRNGWHTMQLDFVQAYPQAPAERDYYMEIPAGMQTPENKDKVLKVVKNIYGQVQASRVWNQYLVDKLLSVGFKQSEHDECIFYKGKAVYALYTDDSILAGPDKEELEKIYLEMKSTGLDMTKEEGGLEDFLGVNIERINDTTFHLSQPQLIDKLLSELGLTGDNVAIKDTPAIVSRVLSSHKESEDFDQHFHYRKAVGILNHLERCTRPDIAYATHQCARFSANPKKEHGAAVKWLGRYLRGTRDKGIYLNLEDENFEVWADADFAGNWVPEDAQWDRDTARSRSGFVIKYLGVPILWKSQLQDTISLSTTEAEYVCLSQALRRTIPIMKLVQEMEECGVPVGSTRPKIMCKAFQDNSGALALAKLPSMRPRTKYLNNKYHHFRSFVPSVIDIEYKCTEDMMADTLTKSNPVATLQKHRKSIMGW